MPENSRDIVDLVVEYVSLLHTPGLQYQRAVSHLCAPESGAAAKARDLSAYHVKSFRALRSGEHEVRVSYRADQLAWKAMFRAENGKLVEVEADWAVEPRISSAA